MAQLYFLIMSHILTLGFHCNLFIDGLLDSPVPMMTCEAGTSYSFLDGKTKIVVESGEVRFIR